MRAAVFMMDRDESGAGYLEGNNLTPHAARRSRARTKRTAAAELT
jgi:hypothetical protein